MATQTFPSTTHPTDTRKRSLMAAMWLLVVVAVLGVIAYHARMGAVSPLIANPAVTDVPRPVEFQWGNDFPIQEMQWGTVGMMVLITALCVRAWIRRPGHPNVLMVIAATGIVWQDPIMNWAPYAVYNPQLWHWPEDWPLVNLSPTVEPFVVVGYAAFYFIVPFFASNWILRRLQARAFLQAGVSRGSFVLRHPLVSLGLLAFVVGFVFDAILEVFSVHAGLYIYSQVIPWGSLFAGTTFQFPLIWESALVTVVMIPACVLCHRDDTGRTQAERLTQKLRWLPHRPALATFLMMFAILNVAYFLYGAGFAAIRASKLATSVACPWPYPEAKVYDPNGFYEREGHPGPFFEGHWNTWMSAQPLGRPQVERVESTRCGPGRA
jgi:hypothetical protein